jgi:hypothetical protein
MGPQWIEEHWTGLTAAVAMLTAWYKRQKITSTASGFWQWVGVQRELRTELASTQRRLEICGQENAVMQGALERLTGAALQLKAAKDRGLIHVSVDSPNSPTSSPVRSLPLPPETGET